MTKPVIFVALLGLGVAAGASAQSYDQLQNWCYGRPTVERQIDGCTAVINTPGVAPKDLATAYMYRGLARRRAGDDAGAEADIAKARAADPDVAQHLPR